MSGSGSDWERASCTHMPNNWAVHSFTKKGSSYVEQVEGVHQGASQFRIMTHESVRWVQSGQLCTITTISGEFIGQEHCLYASAVHQWELPARCQRLLKDTSGPPGNHHSLAGVFEKPLYYTAAFYPSTAISLQSFWRSWHCYMFGLRSNQDKCWAFIFLEL